MLVGATGALLSPLTTQPNETIPCIAHAVSIEPDPGGNRNVRSDQRGYISSYRIWHIGRNYF